jgi:hypothetical protein
MTEQVFMWKRPIKQRLIKPPTAPMAPVAQPSPWHAVSIVSTSACCQAAISTIGTRFLSREAPRLPLANCSMGARCRCAYQHHGDRRSSARRTEDPWSPGRNGSYSPEKRVRKGGRRSTDAG